VDGGWSIDRYWLEVLSDPKRKISDILIRDFINQYTLHRQGAGLQRGAGSTFEVWPGCVGSFEDVEALPRARWLRANAKGQR